MVGGDAGQRRSVVDGELDAVSQGRGMQAVGGLRDERAGVAGDLLYGELAGHDLGVIHDVVDQRLQAGRVAHDNGKYVTFLVAKPTADLLSQYFQAQADGGDGSAQLVS